jgi:hypothetical protein
MKLNEIKKTEDEPKSQTRTKERTKDPIDDILNKPRSKGDLSKVTPKQEPGEEPTATKHRSASAASTAHHMKDVKLDDVPDIHDDEIDTTDEIDDEEAASRAGHHAAGVELRPTPENLPAILSRAMVSRQRVQKGAGKEVAGHHPADVEWHMVKHLPGYLKKVIRAVGRGVFKPFTSTPIEDIQVVANVGGGPNTMQEIDAISKFVSHHGKRLKDAELYFHKVIPGYGTKVVVYDAVGFTFMFVKDFAGSYIYSWPEHDTKRDEFHGEPPKAIGHDKPQLTHEKPEHERDLEDLMKKYGV